MAKVLKAVRLKIEVDGAGVPASARASYRCVDDITGAVTNGQLAVAAPDFTKTMHSTSAVGEFAKDVAEAVKAAEGI